MTMPLQKGLRVGLLLVTIAAVTVLVFRLQPGVGEPDFLAYWSAARLLATREDPYDPAALKALVVGTRPERRVDEGEPFASWNPPWLLTLLLPFGLLPFDLAVRAWILFNIVLIGLACALTWTLLNGSTDKRGMLLAVAAGLWSGQSLMTVLAGQTSGLVLIGLVLGAFCLRQSRDSLAGATFFVAAIKPHVTYLAMLLLLLWIVRHRRWQVLGGMIGAGIISMAILSAIFPNWVLSYLKLIASYRFLLPQYTTATIGSLAHTLLGTKVFRLAGIGLLPLVFPLLRLADSRGWLIAMNVALLVSVPLAVYGFGFDQIVLLPAILQLVSWLWHAELSARAARVLWGGCAVVYATSFALVTISWRHSYWFALIPLAWAGLYVLALRYRTGAPREQAAYLTR